MATAEERGPAVNLVVFIGRRLVRLVLSLLVVSVLTFGLLQLAPGDFADIQAAGGGSVGLAADTTATGTAELSERYGQEVPPVQQYLTFMRGVVTFDMGPSLRYTGRSVEEIIAEAFPVSASLALLATLLAVLVAVPVGMLGAVRRGTWWDTAALFVVTVGHGLPNYLAALALTLVLATGLGLLPTFGWTGPHNMIMPVLALAVAPIGTLARYVRSSMLENLGQDYVVAARSKGGPAATILVVHVLRNSLVSLVTVLGPMLASLATGTVFVEQVFGIPGLGLYFAEAAASRDMPLLMGTTLFFAALLMTINLLVDLSYAALDPRVRADLGLSSGGSRRDRARVRAVADRRSEEPTRIGGPL